MKKRLTPPSAHDLRRAVRHHQAGQLARAEALYLNLLRGQPANPEILNQLGVLHCQRGELETGLEYLTRATELKADAGSSAQFGARLPRAETVRQFDRDAPGNIGSPARGFAGTLRTRRRLADDRPAGGGASRLPGGSRCQPRFFGGDVRLANLLRARGRLDEALQVCGEAVRRGPVAPRLISKQAWP